VVVLGFTDGTSSVSVGSDTEVTQCGARPTWLRESVDTVTRSSQ